LIVEDDLKAALDAGQVGGVALDVFPVEPAKTHPLFGRDDVVCTPHLGASTSEAQENVALQIAEQISDFLLSGAVVNAVNMPSVSADDAPKLQPYMTLARNLGSFLGQLADKSIKAIRISYEGQVAALNTKPLTACVLTGVLAPQLETVNMVNAPTQAKARNIDVTETLSENAGNYRTLIKVTIEADDGTRTIMGSLFGDDNPRIVEIEGIKIEAEFFPHVLLIRNIDKPGFVGNLGRALGDSGINIATFHMGRIAAGGNAICLILVDSAVTEPVLAKVRAIPHVVKARLLTF
jgi:D-3-phosphoglycerate dehydrogenase